MLEWEVFFVSCSVMSCDDVVSTFVRCVYESVMFRLEKSKALVNVSRR